MCDLKGRDCIEANSAETFNCSTTCVGIYADVQFKEKLLQEERDGEETEKTIKLTGKGEEFERQLADFIRREMFRLKSSEEAKGEKVDEKKYKMLVAEYRKFKEKNVKHFKIDLRANASAFGEFKHPWFDVKIICYSRPGTTPLNSAVGGDILRHGYLRRHRERQEDQDGGPAESHWRHHGSPHWLFHYQWG